MPILAPIAAFALLTAVAGADGEPAADPAAAGSRWSVVKDDTLGVRPEEAELYRRVLIETVAANPATLKRDADAFAARRPERGGRAAPAFVDLFGHPDDYRGKPVTLTGHVRVVREFPGPEPPGGGEPAMLVEAWLFTPDSQGNPAVIVASAADDLPRGDDLLVPATVTGRFFKRYGYEAQDTIRTAPLILAATIDRLPDPAPGGAGPVVIGAIVGVTLLGLSAGWWAWRGRPKRRRVAATAGGEAPELPPLTDEPGGVVFEELS